ncbi:MAG TPA: hypothetical protein VII95_12695 [Terriglobales bacterium]|jgi:hypothetical protein
MKVGGSKDLLKLSPFPSEKYEELSLATLTAYSVYWLTQWELSTTLENLAVLNFKLFPTKFAMVGWPEFPDVNRTNRSVLQMRPKYRNFATSITNKGVFLNGRGVDEAQSLIGRLGTPSFCDGSALPVEMPIARVRGSGRPTTVHAEDLVAKVKRSRLFQAYKGGRWADAEPIDLINFLEVYDHTPSDEKRRRLRSFETAANEMKDAEVSEFLEAVSSTFRSYLHR